MVQSMAGLIIPGIMFPLPIYSRGSTYYPAVGNRVNLVSVSRVSLSLGAARRRTWDEVAPGRRHSGAKFLV